MNPLRRVVTGLDAQGRSCVLFDDVAQTVIWSADEAPVDNSGTADAGGMHASFPTTGAQFMFADLPPGMLSPMHATDTIDYTVVVSGEVMLITETGETKLRAGDVFVQRGVVHAWRNDSHEPCRMVSVLAAAKPVGKGATMSGKMGA